MSRRAADKLIEGGEVKINGQVAKLGANVSENDKIEVNGKLLNNTTPSETIILNKPIGFVCSRDGQGSRTVYDLLPNSFHHLKPVGRLDKDSSGLLLLTNDGQLANRLTHPSYKKAKVYEVKIDKPLAEGDFNTITKIGVSIGDERSSRLKLQRLADKSQRSAKPLIPNCHFLVTISEGRNRQIRRTFETLGYRVIKLHRVEFGNYKLGNLPTGEFKPTPNT